MGIINQNLNSKALFLIDGIGAVISAIMLGLVLPSLNHLIGMPLHILQYLAIAACLFATYSLACYKASPNRWHQYLRLIGMINLIYCAVSLGLVFYYFPQLSKLGLAYFIIEKLIVFPLALIEIKASIR